MGLVTLTFDLLTLKLVNQSHLRWGTFTPNLCTLGHWIFRQVTPGHSRSIETGTIWKLEYGFSHSRSVVTGALSCIISEIKRDIGWKSRFFIRLHLPPSLGGPRRNVGMQFRSFMRNLTSWSVPFWLVLLTEHEVLQCYALNVVCRCLVAGQLNPSCGFSSADCRCFQVSDPCQAIHSTAFVLQTALTDRDYLIKIACFCKMILFHFYWYLGLDSFPR